MDSILYRKIVIIGPPGAGKTTLAKELGSMLKIKVYHLDRFFWRRKWKRETREERIDILKKFVKKQRWIIEGTYLNTSKLHLKAADTIIFLDTPPSVCLLRITKRHLKYRGRPRCDIPKESTDKLTLFRMLKVLAFPFRERRTLKQTLRNYESKQIIRLHSSEEVEAFLAYQRVSSSIEPKRQGMIRTTNHWSVRFLPKCAQRFSNVSLAN